jgi:CheY-like chemotaxis protein
MTSRRPEPRMILIAERDQNVRELLRYFLGEAGFDVEFVGDGQTALERAQVSRASLIVTEILLPKVDGLMLCRRLRENQVTRDIPIVVFSILAAEARATEAGANAFLRKPLVESTFLATVQRLFAAQPVGIKEKQWVSQ